jgi:hypothetical protein
VIQTKENEKNFQFNAKESIVLKENQVLLKTCFICMTIECIQWLAFSLTSLEFLSLFCSILTGIQGYFSLT